MAPPLPAADSALALEFTGCAAVRAGGVCLVDEHGAELTLWADVPATPALAVAVDEVVVPAHAVPVDGGQQLRVRVPATARTLRVRHPVTGAGATLRLGAAPRPGDLRAAWLHLLAGDLAMARTKFVGGAVAGLVWLRRQCFKEGAFATALQLADVTAAIAGRAGLVSELSEATQAGAFILTQMPPRDPGAAARWLAREADAAREYPLGRARAAYFAGLVAYAVGDLRAALREFADSERRSARLGLVPDMLAASQMHAVLLGKIGRADEVMQRVERSLVLAGQLTDCDDRATLLTNLGWAQLQLHTSGQATGDPVPALAEGLALSETDCPDPARADTLRINLALAALDQGDPEEARPLIDELGDGEHSEAVALWRPELEARAALLEGRLAALADPVLEPDPSERDDPELRWPGTLRRAESLAAWGLREPAIEVLRAAEQLLDDQVLALAVDEGREKFMLGHRRSAELLVLLLAEAGRAEEALCAARRARVRTLLAVDRAARIEGLDAAARARWDAQVFAYRRHLERVEALRRDRWQYVGATLARHDEQERLAREDLRRALDGAYAVIGGASPPATCAAPADGELLLLVQSVSDGHLAFAADPTGVAVTRLGAIDRRDLAGLSHELLRPFAAQLQRARVLRVLATSALAEVPVHALPWGDDIVLATMPVVYGLDLPGARGPVDAGRSALVVADPTGNLAHARAEAGSVEAALRGQGWRVEVPADVSGAAMRAALVDVDLLHYAGHGRSEGVGGWGSVLVLGDDSTLGIGDILALPRVPGVVVLSGCETGTSDAQSLAGGMNLGRAFLLAGSRTVVAATGVLDDEIAAAVSAELYREFAPGHALDGPATLRRALLAVRAAHPGHTGWMQLHALEP